MPVLRALRTTARGIAKAYPYARTLYQFSKKANKFRKTMKKVRNRRRNKRKNKRSKAARIGTAMFVSHYGWGKPISKAMAIQTKGVAVNKQLINGEFQLQTATAGVQAVSTGGILYAHAYTPYDIYTNVGGGTEGGSAKTFHKKCSLTLLGTNQTNTNCFVDIYTVRCKKHVPGNYSPYDHWATGMDNEAGTGTKELNWNVKPTDSSLFRNYWEILHVDSHSLGAGETLKHNCSVTPNRTIKYYDTQTLAGLDTTGPIAGNYGGIVGLTTYLLIVAYAAPYSETTVEDSTGATSLGAVKVVFTFSKRYTSCTLEDNRDSMTVYNNLVTSFAGGQHVMEAPTAIEGPYEEA